MDLLDTRPVVARVGPSLTLYMLMRGHMRHMQGMGYRIVCVCDEDEWAARLRREGFEVVALGMGRRPGIGAAIRWGVAFYRLLNSRHFDIVHTSNAFHGVVARLCARVVGVTAVHTVHNWFYLRRPGPRRRLYQFAEAVASRLGDLTLFVNGDDAEMGVRIRIVPARKASVVGDGVDIAAFIEETVDAHDSGLRRELGISDHARVIAMIARTEPPKDHLTFIEAVEILLDGGYPVQALVVGGGCEFADVCSRVGRSHASEYIHILGTRTDVSRILSAADVVVLSSSYEAFGRSLVEAMLAGKPVVGTDVHGIRDIIRDEATGLLVPPRDPRALANAVRRLSGESGLCERITRAAAADARERFDLRRVSQRIAVNYELLLGKEERRKSVERSATSAGVEAR